MSDYRHNITVPLGLAAKYWKAVEYGTLIVLFLLKTTNPIFKIALALHVGLQTMLILSFSPLVYYRSSIGDDESSSKGLIQKFTGFVPGLIKKLSGLVLQVTLKSLRAMSICDFKVDINRLASVVTYFLIIFRKLLALMVFTYVTSEDDESTHKKAFALFTIFMAMEMKYILDLSCIKNGGGTPKPLNGSKNLVYKTIKLLYTLEPPKISGSSKNELLASLHLVRSRLYHAGVGLAYILMYYTFKHATELIDDDFIWMSIMKSLIAIDALFIMSFVFELSGLNLHFSNKEDTYV
ncbi:hypothetical protein PICMEDRAFT_74057 [Pichia membranifaciens NRRL Y-2026]|uniref:Uncharacterized protein n=1 Tax=Pichia membranifaciens NRRL Y-2026 TaxID=763406 RepID=A0A1E3NI92_9ASCO|nr:hypothetical protein PICMEDRAFT_74057 [Pichia membranifaciens NRRL Y-2026]ODQ45288.1 hypothetical protein PICMEDRAFT_74057 [Pichia membranifaciens NRRL Y-2026]